MGYISGLIDRAVQLIKFPSLSSDFQVCTEMLTAIEHDLKDIPNVIVKRFESNGHPSLVATIGDTRNPQCFLYSHLDIVPAHKEQFEPEIKRGRLYGRGSGDMKGPAAACIEAFIKFAKNDPRSIGLMLTTDEEIGGMNGVNYLLDNCDYSCEVAIIPDNATTLSDLIINQKGIILTKVWAEGHSAHGSRPWLGENAIDRLYLHIQKLREKFPLEPKGISVNLGKICAGDQINQVPDYAEAYLDLRFPQTADYSKIIEALNEVFNGNFEVILDCNPFVIESDNEWLSNFKQIIEVKLNKEALFKSETGGSDARFFSNRGMSTIVTGISKGNTHAEDEWVDIAELETFYNSLIEFGEKHVKKI